MKRFIHLLAILLLTASVGKAQDVGADRKLDAEIQNYRTYVWSSDVNKIPNDAVFVGPNNVVVFNNETTRSNIKEAIQYELDARGYKMVQNDPDFIVSFIVLERPAELTTYNGYRLLYNGLDTVRTKENIDQVTVEEGTVLVSFLDFDTGREVWRGYASGILKPDMVNDQSKIRSAIQSIFEEYKYKALAQK